jgi:hypothetical protein
MTFYYAKRLKYISDRARRNHGLEK